MKIVFIFAFVLVCGLALGEEKRTDVGEKTVDFADPTGTKPICKSIGHVMNSFLFSLNSILMQENTGQRKPVFLHILPSIMINDLFP